jgi:hypothetical protein
MSSCAVWNARQLASSVAIAEAGAGGLLMIFLLMV